MYAGDQVRNVRVAEYIRFQMKQTGVPVESTSNLPNALAHTWSTLYNNTTTNTNQYAANSLVTAYNQDLNKTYSEIVAPGASATTIQPQGTDPILETENQFLLNPKKSNSNNGMLGGTSLF